ncbi:alpha-glucosidase [Liquorilactobacillus satsumensis]|uniref:glycoside hydrolase family 13 protein n=1 Tax=Liquorilactobacillus satsumensis TaxID=259059 RepID=UPI0021C33D48|nr:alpha-glucosidase [Liquorilactobacillus satsumensis]MCP9312977.1 alpha-glucosidase [Liquorilactobacillus satsumensis]MCP9328923.1 alpha-glucosidase [Liquorilactobacillus satsumensis]MCP9360132.1 alpha-glucosidase [Liquorilactobacillus satsumensis]
MKNTRWWKNELVYQVYPRSFQDTNNDGIGDLRGVIQHLAYFKSLGVTMLWISPVYQSPMVDMGYDISDYEAIDPQFGTMADFDELLEKAQKMKIKLIMDLVINHTSDQHAWFKQALATPDSPYRNYYIFKTTANGKAPNNWRSIFGGSTWTEVPHEPGTFYFHTFAPQQPDLNWENPQLRQKIYRMINWWLDKGIAGFRIDAITHLKKDLDWASLPADGADGLVTVTKKGQNRPGLELFLDELKKETFDKYHAVTIGEAYGVPKKDLAKFIGPAGYFSMIFDFSYINIDVADVDEWDRGHANWSVTDLKQIIFEYHAAIQAVAGWTANVLENHDQPRVLSKLIKDKRYQTPTAAKALATMYYFLPGVPFIYQGQEIGMKNFERQSIKEFNDVSSLNNYQVALAAGQDTNTALALVNERSRDNARTPMQWDSSQYGGFSQTQPWLKMGTDIQGINVAAEEVDPTSTLNYYRQLAKVRQDPQYHAIFIEGSLEELKDIPADVLGYQRVWQQRAILVLVNLSPNEQHVTISAGRVLINNQTTLDKTADTINLRPYQAVVLG